MITSLLTIILIVLAVPVGLLIAWMARDELKQGRKWFKILIVVSIIFGILFAILGRYGEASTCLFIVIITGISLWKSYDKRWIKGS